MEFPDQITIRDLYGPAMNVQNQKSAKEYFEALVARNMRLSNNTREEAESVERANLGYFAGYCSKETRERVIGLYGASHPVFGDRDPVTGEALSTAPEPFQK